MPRPPRPWYRSGRSAWCVYVRGRLVKLIEGPPSAENELLARDALSRLLEAASASASADLARTLCVSGQSVSDAIDLFLSRSARLFASGALAKHSFRNYRTHLKPLRADFGSRALSSLSADELESWAARPGWSPSYRHGVLGTVRQLLKFAGVSLDRPLVRPPQESRGAEVCLSDDQFTLVLDKLYLRSGAKGDLRELLLLLRETGARPCEVLGLTAEAVDWSNACVLLKTHKTKGRTGKDRLIVFNAAALAVLQAQRARYGSGLLFRTRFGRAYRVNTVIVQLMAVSARVGFRVIAYGLGRHSFATSALVNGVPEPMVAALLGHTSTAMVSKHYSHVGSQARAMRAAAEKARGKAG